MRNWAYLATAPSQFVAEMWRDMLVQEGIPAALHPEDIESFIGVSTRPVRLIVAEEKLETAQKVIAEWEDAASDDDRAGEAEEETGEGAEPRGR